jgi:hypothetical protein
MGRAIDGQPKAFFTAAAGRYPGNQPGAVFETLLGMKRTLSPGQPLNDDCGFFIDKNAHDARPKCFMLPPRLC